MRALALLVAPPLCGICGGSAEPQTILCPRCKTDLRQGSGVDLRIPHADLAWAGRPYEGIARDLVTHLKFSSRLRLAERAAQLIAAEAPLSVLKGSIVPVPAAPRRRLWRGFDPAEEIARALASITGLPLNPCLARTTGPRQVGRDKADRVGEPPRVWTRSQPTPPRALLVDDVTTTGATLAACATALRASGTQHVHAVAFAATP